MNPTLNKAVIIFNLPPLEHNPKTQSQSRQAEIRDPFLAFGLCWQAKQLKGTQRLLRQRQNMTKKQLQTIARDHGTPVVVIDHNLIRDNYAAFKKHLPKVQAYYAVKANAEPAIIRTLYRAGASFDVASLPEFMLVYENIKHLPPKEQQDFIWDKIIYANPTKPKETLQALDQYKPLVTYDNLLELKKIKQYAPTPAWSCACASPTPARWSSCPRNSAATRARRWI